MKNCRFYIEKPVYSLQDGSFVGQTTTLVLNRTKKVIEYLGVSHEVEGTRFVPVKKVVGFGDFAFTIRTVDALVELSEEEQNAYTLVTLAFLEKGKVMKETGDFVGDIWDLTFHESNFKLLEIHTKEMSLPISDMKVIGKDIFILRNQAILESAEEKEEHKAPKKVKEEPKVEKLNPLVERQIQLLLGKKLTKNIYTTDGTLLFEEGAILKYEDIVQAQKISPNIIIECSLNIEL